MRQTMYPEVTTAQNVHQENCSYKGWIVPLALLMPILVFRVVAALAYVSMCLLLLQQFPKVVSQIVDLVVESSHKLAHHPALYRT